MFRQITGRCNDEGENDRDLPVGIGEPGKLLLLLDDIDRIRDELSKTGGKDSPLARRAVIECDAFRRLPKPHHGITEVCLQLLLHEIQPHEPMPDPMRDPRADEGVDERGPHEIAVDMVRLAAHSEGQRLRQLPQHKNETDDGGDGLQKPRHERKRARREKIDVF